MKKRKRKKEGAFVARSYQIWSTKNLRLSCQKKKNNNKEKNLAKKATQSGKEILVLVVVFFFFFRSIVVGLSKCNNFNYF